MNFFDENEKTMLDTGGMVVLDGKYFAMTPETLNQAVKNGLMITMEDTNMEQTTDKEANDSFMEQAVKCHFCGKESDCGTEYIITIEGGYNSGHDMEAVSMNVCGGCLEKMLEAVSSE